MKTISVINGPNLNTKRNTVVYKTQKTLTEIEIHLTQYFSKQVNLAWFQSNSEAEIIDKIQNITANGILINAGAYTHTSIAIRDALMNLEIPIIEVHMSNIFAREKFRSHSYISDISYGIVSGFGDKSYYLGIKAMLLLLDA